MCHNLFTPVVLPLLLLTHTIIITTTTTALLLPLPQKIQKAIDSCYPPTAYDKRRTIAYDAALSTTQTFTPEGIPLAGDSMVYGEFSLPFFSRLLELSSPRKYDTFVDVGSGTGRLILTAALLHPRTFGNCHGVELSRPLHEAAIDARCRFEELNGSTLQVPIAPCQYTVANVMEDEGRMVLREADIAFSYAVTWANDETHARLVRTFADVLEDGARVISIDLPLDDDKGGRGGNGNAVGNTGARFELLAKEVGRNEETGDDTVGYVYKVVKD